MRHLACLLIPRGTFHRSSVMNILWSIFLLTLCSTSLHAGEHGAICGTVFRDLNADGTRQKMEQGEAGVIVQAFDAQRTLAAETKTRFSGKFCLQPEKNSATVHQAYRIIFSGWKDILQPGPHGPNSGTETQVAYLGDHQVDFGLFNPEQFSKRRKGTEDIHLEDLQLDAIESQADTAAGLLDGKMPAPLFPEHSQWFNVTRPLTLRDLRGKVVLLVFWTDGCALSLGSLPKLKLLQSRYGNRLAIIGVHAPRYPVEHDLEQLQQTLREYAIDFPVITDHDYSISRAYGSNTWPGYALINPVGRFIGIRKGAAPLDYLSDLINLTLDRYDKKGIVDDKPLPIAKLATPNDKEPLLFPQALLAHQDRLYIADTGHHRILITDLNGKILDQIGSGVFGWQDGNYHSATMTYPVSIAKGEDKHTLYVAERYTNVVRRIDLKRRTISRVAGTNEIVATATDAGSAIKSRLNFPQGLYFLNGKLYIAMAGSRQIWQYDPKTGMLSHTAGNGQIGTRDGSFAESSFVQPHGLTSDGKLLFVIDSEGNSLRVLDFNKRRVIKLTGGDYTHFGDHTGPAPLTLFSRPTASLYLNKKLLVADTYNHSIKVIDLKRGKSSPLLLVDEKGHAFDKAIQSMAIAGEKLFLLDTGNASIYAMYLNGHVAKHIIVQR